MDFYVPIPLGYTMVKEKKKCRALTKKSIFDPADAQTPLSTEHMMAMVPPLIRAAQLLDRKKLQGGPSSSKEGQA